MSAGIPAPRVAQLVEALAAGGAESLAIGVAASLASRGRDSRLIVTRSDGPLRHRVDSGILVHDLQKPICRGGQVRRILDFLDTCQKLERVLREQEIDVLQTHLPKANFLGLVMAWRGACRVYATVHNNREFDYGEATGTLKHGLRRMAYRAMVHSCDGVIAVSERVRQSLADQLRLGQGETRRIRVVTNGVAVPPAIDISIRAKARDRWRVADGEILVVGVGRLTEQKNFSALIEALATLRDLDPENFSWRCIIAGDGELRDSLQARVNGKGLQDRVIMAGLVEDVAGLLCAADIFCLPSLFEGLPLALLEAMARALPVVAFAIDGVMDVVTDGVHGLVVSPGATSAFATALRDLIADGEKRAVMGAAGRRLAGERFDFERTVDALDAIYAG